MDRGYEALIRIIFSDRPGLGYDVFQVFENYKVEKVAMEVSVELGMMIKFICADEASYDRLVQELRRIPGVTDVVPAPQMPFEDRENQLRTLLDVVSEGIIAINREGQVSQINKAAEDVLHLTDSALGQPIGHLLEDRLIQESLRSGQIHGLFSCQATGIPSYGRFLCSSTPIINNSGQVTGTVITIKGEAQIHEILNIIHEQERLTTFSDIIFQTEIMRKLIDTAKTVARSHSTVLLRGESGTGKERFSHAIHTSSPRKNRPFVAVNCTALPESLFESELFGYEPGAFTGAMKEGKKGLFEQAHTGTLFLDEIGELPMPMQARLLRTLQEGTIRKIGGSREIPVDVRIIAATHRNLEQLIEQGQFREDLYYRLNVIPLFIPPLRQRREDILPLVLHLLRKLERKVGKSDIQIERDAMLQLQAQPWPGNVRQLENLLEHVLNMVPSHTTLTSAHFSEWLADLPPTSLRVNETDHHLQITIPIGEKWPTLKEIVHATESAVIEQVLKDYPSSRKAGQILGVSNTTILNKINRQC